MELMKQPRLGETSQPHGAETKVPANMGLIEKAGDIVRGIEAAEILRDAIAGDSNNLDAALQALLDHEAEIDALEAKLKAAGQARANAEKAIIDKMLEQGLDSFKALGKTVTRTERVYPSVLKDDRDRQMEWLREIGMGAIIQPTVNSNTFAGFVRSTFIEPKAEDKLPEFVKIYREPRLAVRTVAK